VIAGDGRVVGMIAEIGAVELLAQATKKDSHERR
jgi:hypothetical protein